MTLPQLVASMTAGEKHQATYLLELSSAVWAGVAPTVSKEGARAAEKWRAGLTS